MLGVLSGTVKATPWFKILDTYTFLPLCGVSQQLLFRQLFLSMKMAVIVCKWRDKNLPLT